MGEKAIEERQAQVLLANVHDLRRKKPGIVFKTETMIMFREVTDLIAYMHQHKFKLISLPAWRYYCREDGKEGVKTPMNRLYYEVEVSNKWKGEKLKLVSGDATDYSGTGNSHRELMEFFLTKILKLPIEERPLSYLFNELENELFKLTMKGGE